MGGLFSGGAVGDPGSGQPQGIDPRILGLLGAIQAGGAANPPQAASRLPLAKPSLGYILSQAAGGFGSGYEKGQATANQTAETQSMIPFRQSQTAGANLGNLTNLQSYNMWAPVLGQKPISLQELQTGKFDTKTMQVAQSAGQPSPQSPAPQNAPAGLLPPQSGQSPAPPQTSPQQPSPGGLLGAPGGAPPNAMPTSGLLGQGGSQASAAPPSAPQQPSNPQSAIQQMPYLMRKRFAAAGGPPTSPIEDQAFNAGLDPDSPQVKAAIALEMNTKSGMIIPPGRNFPGASFQNGQYIASPQGISDMAKLTGAQKRAELPAQEELKRFEADLPFGAPGGSGARQSGGGGQTQLPAPASSQQGSPQPVKRNMDGSTVMSDQSVIPSASEQSTPDPTRAGHTEEIKEWRTTQNDWYKSVQTSQIGEQRALAIADALKKTQSGAWATEKADVAATLKAVGINLSPSVLGDPAQVQIALKDNFNAVLEQIKQFSSRPAAAEVMLAQKNFSNPNLQPAANLAIIGQVVGTLRWERSMLNSWPTAKQNGWQNPQEYQRAWTNQNSLPSFIEKAVQSIGPLQGMEGAPSGGFQQGMPTATNKSGDRMFYDGKQWQPLK